MSDGSTPSAPTALDPVAIFRAKAQVKAGLFGRRHHDVEGPRVGRYTLLHMVGRGGFGVVFRARDPKLDREVAVKLVPLEPGLGDDDLEEARLLARLRHPALVAVHDVGTCDATALLGPNAQRCMYIVMELLGGQSLRQWLASEPRPRARIMAALAQAGEGIAAAHAQGVVHRDLKPSNIHVDGARVCVLDFGLARVLDEDILDRSGTFGSAPTSGTPSYMAPEQLAGGPATPASDQFALALCSYEALYGERPSGALRREPGPRLPARRGVPRRVRRALERALRTDPRQRFESMRALVEALRGRRRRRRGWAVAALVAGAAATTAFVTRPTDPLAPPVDDPCARFESEAAELWNDQARSRVRTSFDRLGRTYAEVAFARVDETLDHRLTHWTRTRTAACRARDASTEDGTSAALEYCLDRYLERAAAVVAVLEDADVTVVQNVHRLGEELDRLERCQQERALPPRPGWLIEDAREGLEIATLVARAQALAAAGKDERAQDLAEEAARRARALEAPGLQAEAAWIQCNALGTFEERTRVQRTCERALVVSRHARRPDLAIDAHLHIASALLDSNVEGAWHQLALAEASRRQLGLDPVRDAQIARLRGVLLRTRGEHQRAVEALTRAREVFTAELGPNAFEVHATTNDLALTLQSMGELSRAETELSRALLGLLHSNGPGHPRLAVIHNNLGSVCHDQGNLECARESLEHALAIKRSNLGPRSPGLLSTLRNLSYVYADLGDREAAVASLRQAIEIAGAQPGEQRVADEFRAMELGLTRIPGDVRPCESLQAMLDRNAPGASAIDLAVLGGKAASCWRDAARPETAARALSTVLEGNERGALSILDLERLLKRLAVNAYLSGDEAEARRRLEQLWSNEEASIEYRREALAIHAVLAGPRTREGRRLLGRALTLDIDSDADPDALVAAAREQLGLP